MRISIGLVIVTALVALAVVLLAGQMLIQPDRSLITAADFSLETITPNADRSDDVTEFSYSLSRSAQVSISFTAEDGTTYFFRQNQPRGAGDYSVLFSGVVDGYTLPGETIAGEVKRRLIPEGQYTWTLEAVDTTSGEQEQRSGTLTITQADEALPEIVTFTVTPDIFTPNQDGIADRTQVNVYLAKESDLTVYLQGQTGGKIYLPERIEDRQPGEPGRHLFDYDGGIDMGVQPPPDGEYTVVAVAQDAVGQRIERQSRLVIEQAGDPLAEIAPQPVGVDVIFATAPFDPRYLWTDGETGDPVDPPSDPQDLSFNAVTMPVGDLLVFKLTIENYGTVPIRTTGPLPGAVYEQDQVAATLGYFDESGAWRVGIDCDTATRDYPWRWAVGSPEVLVEQVDPVTGNTYYYLPPGERSVVWGAVRMTNLIEARNPQKCWAGLIHEDVEVSIRNANVGARDIELVDPAATTGG